jgi:tRNA pseudouridine38-40 synthase
MLSARLMKARAIVAYDGTEFSGFQRQTNVRSVQGELERAIEQITGQKASVTGAGRTDAGVHAIGQVVAFETEWKHPLDALQRALNVTLAEDMAVRALGFAPADFHPRYDALSRTYEYTIIQSEVRQPLVRRYAWQTYRALDVESMNIAAQGLIGEHDFVAFGSAPSGSGESTTRRVLRAEWRETDGKMVFEIEANAFLFRMVRRIVATLARVGAGELSKDEVSELLDSRNPDRVKGAAPACGLCLVKVSYE